MGDGDIHIVLHSGDDHERHQRLAQALRDASRRREAAARPQFDPIQICPDCEHMIPDGQTYCDVCGWTLHPAPPEDDYVAEEEESEEG